MSDDLRGETAPTRQTLARRRVVEDALRESEARFQTLVENLSDIVVELDEESFICWLSPSVETILGRRAEDLIGTGVRPIVHPEDLGSLVRGLGRAYRGDDTVVFSYRLKHCDGHWIWIEGSGRCFLTSSGKKHFVGVGRDVSEYNRMLAILERQHRVDQQISEFSRRFVALAANEIDSAIQTALDEIVRIAGADRGYLLGVELDPPLLIHCNNWSEQDLALAEQGLHPAGEAEQCADVISVLDEGGALHIPDTQLLADQGQIEGTRLVARGVCSFLAVPLRSGDRTIGSLGLERLGGTKVWSEREIREMRLIADVLSSVLLRKSAELALARQVRLERRVTEISNRFLGATTSDLRATVIEMLEGIADVARVDRVYLLPRPSGYEPVESTVGAFEFVGWQSPDLDLPEPELPAWCWGALLAGKVVRFEEGRALPPDAEAARATVARRGVRSMVGVPLFSKHAVSGMVGFECHRGAQRWSEQEIGLLGLISEMISVSMQRLQAEQALEQSQSLLIHAQKMDAVGRLAGGIAHDFNNLLTIILGYSRVLYHELPPGGDCQDDVSEIRRAAERAADLTRQLLAFSRHDSSDAETIDLNDVVRAVQGILKRLVGKNVELKFDLSDSPRLVHADAKHLEQLLINFAMNSRDAMPMGGMITICTIERLVSKDDCVRHGLAGPGLYNLLEVTDTGEGMEKEVRDRIFEPFFTTKDIGKGTGLGLSIAYSVARSSQGAITVESKPGRGSTFSLLLPKFVMLGAAKTPEKLGAPVHPDETVLIVEDEPVVRRLVARFVEEAGYTVHVANDGPSAIALAETLSEPIDLLVTDVMMAGMSGQELAGQLIQKCPDLPVVYMSGLPLAGEVPNPESPGTVRFLRKPFDQDEFLATIRAALDASRTQGVFAADS